MSIVCNNEIVRESRLHPPTEPQGKKRSKQTRSGRIVKKNRRRLKLRHKYTHGTSTPSKPLHPHNTTEQKSKITYLPSTTKTNKTTSFTEPQETEAPPKKKVPKPAKTKLSKQFFTCTPSHALPNQAKYGATHKSIQFGNNIRATIGLLNHKALYRACLPHHATITTIGQCSFSQLNNS